MMMVAVLRQIGRLGIEDLSLGGPRAGEFGELASGTIPQEQINEGYARMTQAETTRGVISA